MTINKTGGGEMDTTHFFKQYLQITKVRVIIIIQKLFAAINSKSLEESSWRQVKF